jgi:hypothetical protein
MKVGDRVRDLLYERGLGTITEIEPLYYPVPERDEQHFNFYCIVRWDKEQPEFCAWYEDPHLSDMYLDDVEPVKTWESAIKKRKEQTEPADGWVKFEENNE